MSKSCEKNLDGYSSTGSGVRRAGRKDDLSWSGDVARWKVGDVPVIPDRNGYVKLKEH